MLIWLLKKLFSTVIGNLPAEQRKVYLARFNLLLMDIVKAAVAGAAEGAINANRK